MVFGDKSLLDTDTKSFYSKAGASHVLAVSGLHVGIIFLVLNYLFGFFIKGNFFKPRLLRSILIILFLWGYAALTGFSPSVLRASLMFSLLQFGFLFQRPYYVYSSVVASGFILLLCNPSLLFDVGFQLSYSAVLSILFFQPRLSKLSILCTLKECNFVPLRCRKFVRVFLVWSVDLTVVSFAAQLGTLPLVLYYFHQFSFVSFLSGFFVIPLATCLIYLSLVALAVSPVPYISSLLVGILFGVASLTNSIVEVVGSLPFAVLDWVDFRQEDVWVYYIGLFLVSLYLLSRKPFYLLSAGFSVSLLVVFSICHRIGDSNVSFAVYNYPGRSVVNIFGADFNKVYTTADSTMLIRQLSNYWIRRHTVPASFSSSHVLQSGEFSAFVIDKDISVLKSDAEPIVVDKLIVSSDVRIPINQINAMFNYKSLIVDSSCSMATSYWWKHQCPSAFLVRIEGDYIEHSKDVWN